MTSYATLFSGTESPLSEGGAWTKLDATRTQVDTAGGIAFGTQVGGALDDSYAQLTATWPADYQIITRVFKGTTSGIQEIEHCFRIQATSNTTRLYEINFAHDGQYVDFVRWDGGIAGGDFTYLVPTLTYNIPGGVPNDCLLKSQIVGGTLSAWIDPGGTGTAYQFIGSASDTSGAGGGPQLTSGPPGIGFFKTAGSGAMNQYAFKDFSASGASPEATVSKRLFGPATLTNAATTVYTCPALTTAVIRRMRVSNPTGGAVNFTLSLGADSAGTRLYAAVGIGAGLALDMRGPISLAAGDIIQAYASSNSALVLEIDGAETA